jgi:AraC family transcriptional regulator, regulatory protein of adaptative response / methylated-DNA-[protein]-cysteine methyltransferase
MRDLFSSPTYDRDQALMTRAIDFLAINIDDQPTLETLAEAAGLSSFHFQRLFSAHVGVSPKKFLQYLSLDRAKRALAGSSSVLEASFEAGLSGPGRLHDLFLSLEAATPGEFKAGGAGLTIRHASADSPFGRCLLLWSERGVMGLAFVNDTGEEALALEELAAPYFAARFVADEAGAEALAARIFRAPNAAPTSAMDAGGPLKLFVAGTPFQIKVWEALLRIPPAGLVAYDDVAKAIGRPTASRAVGNAVGANPISYLIPCHRVIRRTGLFGHYRWGSGRKALLIGAEGALAEAKAAA